MTNASSKHSLVPIRRCSRARAGHTERSDYDSDFDVFASAGLPGLEFANPKDATRYHTVRDTVDAVDPSLVQSHGETVTVLVRYFGDLDLTQVPRDRDRVFVTLPVLGVVAASTASAAPLRDPRTVDRRSGGVAHDPLRTDLPLAGHPFVRRCLSHPSRHCRESLVSPRDTLTDRWAPADIVASFDDFDGSARFMMSVIVLTIALAVLAAHRMTVRWGPTALLVGSLGLLIATHVLFFLSPPLSLPTTTWPLIAASCAVVAGTSLRGARRVGQFSHSPRRRLSSCSCPNC